MRLKLVSTLALAFAGWLAPATATVASPPAVEASPELVGDEPDPEDDLLGELVVEAKRRGQLVLPRIAVLRPPDEDLTYLHDLLARDLELSGEFELVSVDARPRFDDPVDAEAYAALGLEAVVTADVQRRPDGRFDLLVRVFLPAVGELAAWSKTVAVSPAEGRLAGHRLSDGVIGALTGTDGPFASRLVLVRTEGKGRKAYLVDADGKGLTPISPDEQLVVTATLDADAQPLWAASEKSGAYRLYRAGVAEPLAVEPAGSIYGIALAPNGLDVALAIATDEAIQVFTGALGAPLVAKTKLDFALTPTWTRDGKLVYAGITGKRRSIYVGTKPISPPEVPASSPTVCNHPDGPRVIYSVGLGKNTDLVASDLDGSDMARLTWSSGRNFAPACSPDGRLVAFFSTRKKNGRAGLFLMRVDGRRPRRIHAAVGDVLFWARIPGRPAQIVTPTPEPAREPEPPSDEQKLPLSDAVP